MSCHPPLPHLQVHDNKLDVKVQLVHWPPTTCCQAGSTAAPALASNAAVEPCTVGAEHPSAPSAVTLVPQGSAGHQHEPQQLQQPQQAQQSQELQQLQEPQHQQQQPQQAQQPLAFLKLSIVLSGSFIQHGTWKRSPAAEVLAKQLLPWNTCLGASG